MCGGHSMNFIKSILHKSTTLQNRLTLFFLCTTVFIVLTFTFLLIVFNITDGEKHAVSAYMKSELLHVSERINTDFGKLSVTRVTFAENASAAADEFFKENNINANELPGSPHLIESLLSHEIPYAISVIDNTSCGGVFFILDSTIREDKADSFSQKAGIFIRKTQPVSSLASGGKKHYLRGPASIARQNNIELMGQWKMEFDITNEDFYYDVINTAKKNPDKPLSRLYYWTDRVTLKDDSESNFLLCIPLRSSDGYIYGICGISVSEIMFQQLYCPSNTVYQNICILASPSDISTLYSSRGLLAGNYYLSGTHLEHDLKLSDKSSSYNTYNFLSTEDDVGGFNTTIKLYPAGSPYEKESWSASIIMPMKCIREEISGNTTYLHLIIVILLIVSIALSVFISRHYLKPVNNALDSIKNKSFTTDKDNKYYEINDLMEFLAKEDEENRTKIAASSSPPANITPLFETFLENVKTLSPAEMNVFSLYLKGYKSQMIADELFLSINTVKTHNRRIFAKLNVSSRKELLVYIDMAKEMNLTNKLL